MSSAARILIVDDEGPNRKLLEALLKPEGYETRSVASGEAALASVAENAPDLILLDIMMPGMDGYQVARALKENPATSHIPIIMVTASVGRDARMEGLKAGAEEFLLKPVDRGELWLRVRNLLRLKSLGDFLKNHSVILEREVQARAAELQRFRAAMEISGDGIVLVDRESMRYVDVNQTLCDMVGRTRAEVLAMTPMELFGTERALMEHDYDAIIADRNADEGKVEGVYRHRNGSLIPIETRRRALQTDQGWIIVGTARDTTERKLAESKIRRLNRVYAVLSGINTLIVRVRDRDELYRDACRIAVEDGGFRMAWIGIVDREATQMKIVARTGGDQEYVDMMRLSLDKADGENFGLPGSAVLGMQPVVVQDMQSDVRILLQQEAVQRNFRSLVMLPLAVSETAVGMLALYSSEADFFDDAEMKLLTELAGDISFAIDHIGKQDQLDYLAYYDALTGLANRTLFLERVSQHIRTASAGSQKVAVFLVDLERFKNINDSLGQTAGDALLKQVADWLKRHAGDVSLVARLGADHFALVLPVVREDGGVVRLAEKMLAAFMDYPFRVNDAVLRIAAKVGIALFPADGTDADGILKNAEAALKKAKASGDKILLFTQQMTERVAAKLSLENQLRRALENEEFVLHYQPKVRLADGKVTSAEALIRWNDPQAGLVPPGQFIPILEEIGLINEVGRWALRQAIEDYLRWRAAGLAALRISVNVSPMQLRNRGFVAEIAHKVGVDPHAAEGLELEITESLIMEDVKRSIDSLMAIRAMGVRIAIDDFGTGFSSLSYLARLPVDTLKIDRSFVIDMTAGPDGLALVSTIINLAHSLKLNVVAEGVETDEQSRLLRLLSCDEMQGYLFSRPVPADQFEKNFLAQATEDESGLATNPRFMRIQAIASVEPR